MKIFIFVFFFYKKKGFITEFEERQKEKEMIMNHKFELLEMKVKSLDNGKDSLTNKIDLLAENFGNKIKIVEDRSTNIENAICEIKDQSKNFDLKLK